MRCKVLLCVFMALSMNACAKDRSVRDGCERFRFEGGDEVGVRADAVKSLDVMFVGTMFGAGTRQRLFGVELNISALNQSNSLKEAHLSVFFRPLEADAVECQDVANTGLTRCYTSLSHASLQLAGVFDGAGEMDFHAAMRELAEQVERKALSCN